MIPDFIKAKGLLQRQHHRFLRYAINFSLADFMKLASTKTIYEGNYMSITYEDDLVYEKQIGKISAESGLIDINDLKKDPEKVYDFMLVLAKGLAEAQIASMVKTLTDVSKLTGNVVSGNGSLTPENVFAIIEKIQMSFDENDNPVHPQMLAGTDMAPKIAAILLQIENTPELKRKHDAIIENKRKQWHDRQDSRKLAG